MRDANRLVAPASDYFFFGFFFAGAFAAALGAAFALGFAAGAGAAAGGVGAGAAAFTTGLAAFSCFAGAADTFALGLVPCACSTSRINLSASSCVICPRRTMYCTSSRALSSANAVSPAAAPITSFIAAAILLPASRLISCARAAISATASRTSWPRCPGPRRGGGAGMAGEPPAGVGAFVLAASAGAGVTPLGAGLVIEMVSVLAKATVRRGGGGGRARRSGRPCDVCQTAPQTGVATGAKYMIFQSSCKPIRVMLYATLA